MALQPQDASGVRPPVDQDDTVVLGDLRDAMQETGWTQDALSAVLKLPDRQYVGKILAGEKPINLTRLVALPDDLERAFLTRWTKRLGLVVITPVSQEEASRCLAVGLFSLLANTKVRP